VWGAGAIPTPVDLSPIGVNNEEFGFVSLSNGTLGHFLLDHDDDERDEKDRDDDEREDEDDDDDRKHKGKEDSKSDDLKGKDRDDDGNPKKDHNPKDDDAPLAHPRIIVTEEDTATKIVLKGNAGNRDVIFSIVDGPEHGSLVELDAMNGTVSYVPSADFFGRDSFTFTASDGESDSHPAAVKIFVKGVNDAPLAIGGELVTKEGQSLSVELTATDADNDTLTYVILTNPADGSLTGVAPNLSYLPNHHFDGTDTLSFKVSDGDVDSNVATIVINVKSADKNDHGKASDHWWERTPRVNQGTDGISSSIAYEPAPAPDTAEAQPDHEPQQDQPLSVLPIDLIDTTTDVAESTTAAFVLKDVLAPQFVFPASPLEAIASSYAGTVVTYAVQATDDIDGEVASTCSPSSGSRFPVGKFNVVCTATDSAGNSALSSFIVIVRQASSEDDALVTFLLPTALAAVLGVGAYFGIRIGKRAHSRTS